MRAAASAWAPGGKPTISRMGRVGYSWPRQALLRGQNGTIAATTTLIAHRRFIRPSWIEKSVGAARGVRLRRVIAQGAESIDA